MRTDPQLEKLAKEDPPDFCEIPLTLRKVG